MIPILLNKHEIALATFVGESRAHNAIKNKRKPAFPETDDQARENHVHGACAELAVAKAFDYYWDGAIDTFKRADMPYHIIKVRSTTKRFDTKIAKNDTDGIIIISVFDKLPVFNVKGWIIAKHGKREEFLKSPIPGKPAYFVPDELLNEIFSYDSVGGATPYVDLQVQYAKSRW